HYLRTLVAPSNLQHIDLQPVVEAIWFRRDLLLRRKNSLDFAEADQDRLHLAALHRAGYNLAEPLVELLEYLLALSFAQPLDNHLLRSLRRNSAKGVRSYLDLKKLADLNVRKGLASFS